MESGPALILRTLDKHLSGRGGSKLVVSCLGPVDLALTKMGRGDDADLEDVAFLLESGQVPAEQLRAAIDAAVVPTEYAELLAAAKPKVLGLLGSAP